MDCFNLKQLGVISVSLILVACAASGPQQVRNDAPLSSMSGKMEMSADVDDAVEEDIAEVVVEKQKSATAPVVAEPSGENEVTASNANNDATGGESVEHRETTSKPTEPAPVSEKPGKTGVKNATSATVIPSDPNTFLVQAAEKDPSHPFYNVGDKRGFLVNGVQGKTLVLTRGEKYKFQVDTGIQHDFYFSTSQRGWGAGTVTDGIEGQFTFDGIVTVSPNPSTPNVIYYQCRNHKNMGGKVHVIDEGESVKLDDEPRRSGDDRPKIPAFKVTDQQVKQKLSYAKMLMASPSAKRIFASDNAAAKDLKRKASEYLAKADQSVAAKNNVEAMASVDEALRLINAANQLEPSGITDHVDYKSQYEEMLAEIEGYKKSYQKNAKKAEPKGKARLDQAKFGQYMSEAKKLAASNDHKAAMKPLQSASTMITDVISVMLDDTVVVYDKNFATPKEEYEYELSRYNSYVELVPLAKEQKNPKPRTLKLMDQFVEKGKSIALEAEAIAKKGDYKLAIQAYQAATSNIKRALMMVGVR